MLNLRRWGLLAPKTPRCFLVLDYLFSSTKKLQFYVELAIFSIFIVNFAARNSARATHQWLVQHRVTTITLLIFI